MFNCKMTQKECKYCKKMVVENWEEWVKENRNENYIECCYCGSIEKI